MKNKRFLVITAVFMAISAACIAAPAVTDTVTETVTQTVTATMTETVTATVTPTITMTGTDTPVVSPTPTSTITPTFTPVIPPKDVVAYPNPAYGERMTIAYPLDKNKTALRATISIYAADGSFVARMTDDYPDGYTRFDIRKLARGVYLYKINVKYTDKSEEDWTYKKFAVIK